MKRRGGFLEEVCKQLPTKNEKQVSFQILKNDPQNMTGQTAQRKMA